MYFYLEHRKTDHISPLHFPSCLRCKVLLRFASSGRGCTYIRSMYSSRTCTSHREGVGLPPTHRHAHTAAYHPSTHYHIHVGQHMHIRQSTHLIHSRPPTDLIPGRSPTSPHSHTPPRTQTHVNQRSTLPSSLTKPFVTRTGNTTRTPHSCTHRRHTQTHPKHISFPKRGSVVLWKITQHLE